MVSLAIKLTFVLAAQILGLLAHPAAGLPGGCLDTVYPLVQTILLNPSEFPPDGNQQESPQQHDISITRCMYNANAGLIVDSSDPSTPIHKLSLTLQGVSTKALTFAKNLIFGKGCVITIQDTLITGTNVAALFSMRLIEASFFLKSVAITVGSLAFKDATYTAALLAMTNVTVTTALAAALLTSAVNFTDTEYSITGSTFKTTSSGGYALQWVSSPTMTPSDRSRFTFTDCTFEGQYGFVMMSVYDWLTSPSTRFSFTHNRMYARGTGPTYHALQLHLKSPKEFLFDSSNVVLNGAVAITHYGPTENFKFFLANSSVNTFRYVYNSTIHASINEELRLHNTTLIHNAITVALPTATNAVVSFVSVKASVASQMTAITYRALNGGRLEFISSSLTGSISTSASFLSYKFQYLVQDSNISDCLNMNYFQLYYSDISLNGSNIGCLSIAGQLHYSAMSLSSVSVFPANSQQQVLSFKNDWHYSSLVIARSALSTGYASNHRLVFFSGIIDSTQHHYQGNLFRHVATSSQYGVTPTSCVVCYARADSSPTFTSIGQGSSVRFWGGNEMGTSVSSSYFLFITLDGGELLWEGSNRARSLAPATTTFSGRFYVNSIGASESSLSLFMQEFTSVNQIEIVRYLATASGHFDTIHLHNSRVANLYINSYSSVALNVSVTDTTLNTKISLLGMNMEAGSILFSNVTTPILYQSIGALYTSTHEVLNSRPAILQHFITAYSGSTLRSEGNTISNYFALKGGLFDSACAIAGNFISTSTATAMSFDTFAIRASKLLIANNTIDFVGSIGSSGSIYGVYWMRSIVTVGATIRIIGNSITRHYHSFYIGTDFRSGALLQMSNNLFAPNTVGYALNLNITGTRLEFDESNNVTAGRVYVNNHGATVGHWFSLGRPEGPKFSIVSFQWKYSNKGHTSKGDTLLIQNMMVSNTIQLDLPVTTDAYVQVLSVTTASITINHNQATAASMLVDRSTSSSSVTLSTTTGCFGCTFGVSRTSIATFMAFKGGAYTGSLFFIDTITAKYFDSSSKFEGRSGLRLFNSTMIGDNTPLVGIGGGWHNEAFLEVDSCTFTSTLHRCVSITQSATLNSTHRFTNSRLTSPANANSPTSAVPSRSVLAYTRPPSVTVAAGPSLGQGCVLIVREVTFKTSSAESFFLYVVTNGGRLDYDEPNKVDARYGRFYLYSAGTDGKGAGSLGHRVFLAAQPGANSIAVVEVVRAAGTTGYNEAFDVHDLSLNQLTFNVGNAVNLHVNVQNIVIAGSDLYFNGATISGASVTFRAVTPRGLYVAVTSFFASHIDILDTKATGQLSVATMFRDGSLLTVKGTNLNTESYFMLRGGCFDSQVFITDNRVVTSTGTAFLVDGFTTRNGLILIANTYFQSTASSQQRQAVWWRSSPFYTCSDVIFENNTLMSTYGGFYMSTSDVGAGGVLWFRRNLITRASSYALFMLISAGGRLDYDHSNRITGGTVRIAHNGAVSSNNVFHIGNMSSVGRVDWVYTLLTASSRNDTIAFSDSTFTSYIAIASPSIRDGLISFTDSSFQNIQITSKSADRLSVLLSGVTVSSTTALFTTASNLTNATFLVTDAKLSDTITFNGLYNGSRVSLRNSTIIQLLTVGSFINNATLSMIGLSSPTTVDQNPLVGIGSMFEDGHLLAENCTFRGMGKFVYQVSQPAMGRSTHTYINNSFTGTVTDSSQCCFCYTNNLRTVTAFGGTGSILSFRQNSFMARLATSTLLNTAVGEGALLYFDDSNTFVPWSAVINNGLVDFSFQDATGPGNFISINGNRQKFGRISLTHTGVSTNDVFILRNAIFSSTVVVNMNITSRLQLSISNSSASGDIGITVAQMTGQSTAAVENNTLSTLTPMMHLWNSSVLVRFNIVQTAIRFSTSVSKSSLNDRSKFLILNNTAIGELNAIISVQGCPIADYSQFVIGWNYMRTTATNGDSQYSNVVQWNLSPLTNYSELFFINNTFLGLRSISMITADVGATSTLWFRSNFLRPGVARTAIQAFSSGGRFDIDESNFYDGSLVFVHHSDSANNSFRITNRAYSGTFSWTFANLDAKSFNDVVYMQNVTFPTTVTLDLGHLQNASIHWTNVSSGDIAKISSQSLTVSKVTVDRSRITTLQFRTVIDAVNSIFLLHRSVLGTMSMSGTTGNGSAISLQRSDIGSLQSTGSMVNASLLIRSVNFTSLLQYTVLSLATDWYGSYFEFSNNTVDTSLSSATRLLALEGRVADGSVHQIAHNYLRTTTTSFSSSNTPGSCLICYGKQTSPTVVTGSHSSIGPGSSLTVAGNILIANADACYYIHVASDGGMVHIDKTNVFAPMVAGRGRIFLGLGANSTDTVISLSGGQSWDNIPYLEVARVVISSGFGANETITLSDLAIPSIIMNLGISTNSRVFLRNVTASKLLSIASDDLINSEVTITNITAAVFTQTVTLTNSNMTLNDTLTTTLTHESYAYNGSKVVIGRNRFIGDLGIMTISGGAFTSSTCTIADNQLMSTKTGPLTINALKSNGGIHRFVSNTIITYAKDGNSLYAMGSGASTSSLLLFANNRFGSNELPAVARSSFYADSGALAGAGTMVRFRHNVFLVPTTGSFSLYIRLSGGTIDYDSTNSQYQGYFYVYHKKATSNNLIILENKRISTFYYGGTARVTTNDTIVLSQCLVGPGAVTADLSTSVASYVGISSCVMSAVTVTTTQSTRFLLNITNSSTTSLSIRATEAIATKILLRYHLASSTVSLTFGTMNNSFVSSLKGNYQAQTFSVTTRMVDSLFTSSEGIHKGATTMEATQMINSRASLAGNSLSGAVRVSLIDATQSVVSVADNLISGAMAFEGSLLSSQRVSISNCTVSNRLSLSLTAKSNATFEVRNVTAQLTGTTGPALQSTGTFTEQALLSIRDLIAVVPSGMVMSISGKMARLSIVNSYMKAVVANGLALRVGTSATTAVTSSLELISNDMEGSTGITIITAKDIASVLIANNILPPSGSTFTVPANASDSQYQRFGACNVDRNGNAFIVTSDTVTNLPCDAITQIHRCQTDFNPHAYLPYALNPSSPLGGPLARGLSVAPGAADAAAPQCLTWRPDYAIPQPSIPITDAAEQLETSWIALDVDFSIAFISIPHNVPPIQWLQSIPKPLVDAALARVYPTLQLAQLAIGLIGTSSFSGTSVYAVVPSAAPQVAFLPPLDERIDLLALGVSAGLWLESQPATPITPIYRPLPNEFLLTPQERHVQSCLVVMETTEPASTSTTATTTCLTVTTRPATTTTARPRPTQAPTTTVTFTTATTSTKKPTTTTATAPSFSQLFDDNGLSAPITTPINTAIVDIPEATMPTANSDVGTVPDAFTPPPIEEEVIEATEPTFMNEIEPTGANDPSALPTEPVFEVPPSLEEPVFVDPEEPTTPTTTETTTSTTVTTPIATADQGTMPSDPTAYGTNDIAQSGSTSAIESATADYSTLSTDVSSALINSSETASPVPTSNQVATADTTATYNHSEETSTEARTSIPYSGTETSPSEIETSGSTGIPVASNSGQSSDTVISTKEAFATSTILEVSGSITSQTIPYATEDTSAVNTIPTGESDTDYTHTATELATTTTEMPAGTATRHTSATVEGGSEVEGTDMDGTPTVTDGLSSNVEISNTTTTLTTVASATGLPSGSDVTEASGYSTSTEEGSATTEAIGGYNATSSLAETRTVQSPVATATLPNDTAQSTGVANSSTPSTTTHLNGEDTHEREDTSTATTTVANIEDSPTPTSALNGTSPQIPDLHPSSPSRSATQSASITVTALPSCPLLSLVYPTTVPADEVRGNPLTIRIALFGAPNGFSWVTAPDGSFNGSSINFRGLSFATDTNALIEAAMTVHQAQLLCYINPDTPAVLECQLPPLPSYAMPLRMSEELVGVMVHPTAFDAPCAFYQDSPQASPNIVGSFAIQQSRPTDMAAAVSGVITLAVAAGPVLLALVGDPTNVEVQAIVAMFSAEGCATVDEIEATKIARYIALSPFYDLGHDVVVLAHMGIIVAVALIQILIASVVALHDYVGGRSPITAFPDALQRAMFPHITNVVAGVLFLGLCFSSFELLAVGKGWRRTIGIVGIVVGGIVVFTFVAMVWLKHIGKVAQGAAYLPYPMTVDPEEVDQPSSRCARALSCYKSPSIRRWAWPRGTFAPPATRRAFRSLVFVTVPTRLWLAPYPVVMSFVTALLLHVGRDATAVGNESSFRCSHRWIILALWFALFALMMITLKPHIAVANSHAAAWSYVALTVTAGLSAAESSPEIGRNTGSLFYPKVAMAALLLVIALARTIHRILFTFWLEKPLEEQALKRHTMYFAHKCDDYSLGEDGQMAKATVCDIDESDLFADDPKLFGRDFTVAAPPIHLSENDESSTTNAPNVKMAPATAALSVPRVDYSTSGSSEVRAKAKASSFIASAASMQTGLHDSDGADAIGLEILPVMAPPLQSPGNVNDSDVQSVFSSSSGRGEAFTKHTDSDDIDNRQEAVEHEEDFLF